MKTRILILTITFATCMLAATVTADEISTSDTGALKTQEAKKFLDQLPESLSPVQAVKLVSEARKALDFEKSARIIFSFLCQKRPRSAYMYFLGKIELPIRGQEYQNLENLILDNEYDLCQNRTVLTGHNITAFGNEDGTTRLEVIFLNPAELENYALAIRENARTGKPPATFYTGNLEGRLCGYGIDRKAFLGGKHMEYKQFVKERLHHK